jgi:hypothetical protein
MRLRSLIARRALALALTAACVGACARERTAVPRAAGPSGTQPSDGVSDSAPESAASPPRRPSLPSSLALCAPEMRHAAGVIRPRPPAAPRALRPIPAHERIRDDRDYELYQTVGPSTVVVRTPSTFATGVVVGPGLVLTTAEAVRAGLRSDLTTRVTILRAGMRRAFLEIAERALEGVVVKLDSDRDLALVRIADAPRGLPPVPLAASAPEPGAPAATLTHPSFGRLWAYERCAIEAPRDADERPAVEPSALAPWGLVATPEERAVWASATSAERGAGLVEGLPIARVSASCAYAPGSMGAPLVDVRGQLVGLARHGSDAGTSYVGVSELAAFVREAPELAWYDVPNPWCAATSEAAIEDADRDGTPDVAWARGPHGTAYFFDVDQDDAMKGRAAIPFDAEVALVEGERGVFAWYDADGDGGFDWVAHAKQGYGQPTQVLRLGPAGASLPERAPELGRLISPALLPSLDAVAVSRLGAIAATLGSASASDARHRMVGRTTTDAWAVPSRHAASLVARLDVDGDGRPDALETRGSFVSALAIGLEPTALAAADDRTLLARTASAQLDPALTLVRSSAGLPPWLLVDRGAQPGVDLALALDPAYPVVQRALRRRDDGAYVDAAEELGTLAFRPSRMPGLDVASALARTLGAHAVGLDDGLGALPSPKMARRYGFVHATIAPLKIVEGFVEGAAVVLVDLDFTLPDEAPRRATEYVESRRFVPDFAYLHRAGLAWAYYDRDGDGAFDLVLFAGRGDESTVRNAWRVVDGSLVADAALREGPLVRQRTAFADGERAEAFARIAERRFERFVLESEPSN